MFIMLTLSAQEKSTLMIPSGHASITDQEVTIDGERINLKAHAGTLQLRDENNDPIALNLAF